MEGDIHYVYILRVRTGISIHTNHVFIIQQLQNYKTHPRPAQTRVKLMPTVSDPILFIVLDMLDIRLVINIFNQ